MQAITCTYTHKQHSMDKYKILNAKTTKGLEASVNKHLNGGWRLHGYTFTTDKTLYQVIVR